MKKVAVIFDSKYGSTREMAIAIAEGVKSQDGVAVDLVHVSDASKHWKSISGSDALIFGSPTYMGGVSAEFKKFMELSSTFYAEEKWKNKFSAGFTCSGAASGDKLSTIFQMAVFAAQHGMHWINLGVSKAGKFGEVEDERNLNRLGVWMGAAGQSNSERKSSNRVYPADLATARFLGKRVAETLLHSSGR